MYNITSPEPRGYKPNNKQPMKILYRLLLMRLLILFVSAGICHFVFKMTIDIIIIPLFIVIILIVSIIDVYSIKKYKKQLEADMKEKDRLQMERKLITEQDVIYAAIKQIEDIDFTPVSYTDINGTKPIEQLTFNSSTGALNQ